MRSPNVPAFARFIAQSVMLAMHVKDPWRVSAPKITRNTVGIEPAMVDLGRASRSLVVDKS